MLLCPATMATPTAESRSFKMDCAVQSCRGEVPVAGCFLYLSSCLSSACRISKQRILLLKQTCLELAKKCPAPLVNKKYKKPVLFYAKCNFTSFSNNSVKVSKLQLQVKGWLTGLLHFTHQLEEVDLVRRETSTGVSVLPIPFHLSKFTAALPPCTHW